MSAGTPSEPSQHPLKFQHPANFSKLGNGRWYCTLCTRKWKRAYREAFREFADAVRHESSPEHIKREEDFYATCWDYQPDPEAWATDSEDYSIPDSDPTKELQLKWRSLAAMVDTVVPRVEQWRQDIQAIGGASRRKQEVEAPSPKPSDVLASDLAMRSGAASPASVDMGDLDEVPEASASTGGVPQKPKVVDQPKRSTVTVSIREWLDRLTQVKHYKNVNKSQAVAFFEMTLQDRVARIESISRELGRYSRG